MVKPGGTGVAGDASADILHSVVSADWSPQVRRALVFFHGYAADEQDLCTLGPMLALTVPWASLRGPVTVAHGGYAWFPTAASGGPDPARTMEATWRWIDDHLASSAQVIAIGFSQGGLMATQLLRTRPERVAATVVLSGWVVAAPQPADEQLAALRPPVFWGRGARDRMIAADAIERTRQWLPGHASVTERVYPDLAHGISNQEIDDVRTFLIQKLWGGPSS